MANAVCKDKFLATSSDAERNKTRIGKPARQVICAWHSEWATLGTRYLALPKPLQPMLTLDA